MALPDGHAFVAPRSRANARNLLAAARRLGVPASRVKTVEGGYVVPEEVADEAGAHHPEGAETASVEKVSPVRQSQSPGAAVPPAPEGEPEEGADPGVDLGALDKFNYSQIRKTAIRLGVGGQGSKAEMIDRIREVANADQIEE